MSRRPWELWASTERSPLDPPDAPGLSDLQAAVDALPDGELDAGLRRGLVWARMGLGEVVTCHRFGAQHDSTVLALELCARQWSTVMGACHGALSVARRGRLRDTVRLPDRVLSPVPITLPPERPWTLDDEVLP